MHDIDPRQVVAELLNSVPLNDARTAGPDRHSGPTPKEQSGSPLHDAAGSKSR